MEIVIIVIYALNTFMEISREAVDHHLKRDKVVTSVTEINLGDASIDETCAELGNLAEEIMKIRQTEHPVSEVLKSLTPSDAPKEAQDIVRQVILDAYSQGAMRTEENKRRQVSEFRNYVEIECLQSQK